MNRVEELTLQLIDGQISDAELAELDRLLADNPQAVPVHVSLLDLEAALLSRQDGFDVGPQTMATIRDLASPREPDRIAVIAERHRGRHRRSSRRLLRLVLAASLLAAVGLSVFFSYQRFSLTTVDAQVTQADEGVVIERGGQSLTAQAGLKLTADDRLIVPDSAAASIAYTDDTRVVFGPQAAATLRAGRGPTKRISLERGDLVAHVAKQVEGASLEASTPNARVRVLGTRFLLAATPTGTRLDVIEGRVNMRRPADRVAIDVIRGQFALAASDSPLVAQPLPGRVRDGLLALYRFDEGQGTTVHDQSGFEKPLDLQAESNDGLRWLPSGGLLVSGGTMLSSRQPAAKIVAACQASHELTIEAWVTPSRSEQAGPARIVTLSRDTEHRNFTLGQGSRLETPTESDTCFLARLRTAKKDKNGEPAIRTPAHIAVPDLTHVLFTRSRDGKEQLFVDGILRSVESHGGDFSNWDRSFCLALGNEFTRNRTWEGVYHQVAMYSRCLTGEDVLRNFRAGLASP